MTSTQLSRLDAPVTTAASDRFLHAALDLFIEHGFSGTSLQMIGDRLDVSKAAVTYHFRTKDDLLLALVRPAFSDLLTFIEEVEAIRRESTRRSAALDGYVDYLINHRRISVWLGRDISALAHPALLEQLADLTGRMDALLISQSGGRLGRMWGAATVQALTGPILSATDMGDEELRDELKHIGQHMIRGYQAAVRRHAV